MMTCLYAQPVMPIVGQPQVFDPKSGLLLSEIIVARTQALLKVTASTSDQNTTIDKIDFYLDDNLLGAAVPVAGEENTWSLLVDFPDPLLPIEPVIIDRNINNGSFENWADGNLYPDGFDAYQHPTTNLYYTHAAKITSDVIDGANSLKLTNTLSGAMGLRAFNWLRHMAVEMDGANLYNVRLMAKLLTAPSSGRLEIGVRAFPFDQYSNAGSWQKYAGVYHSPIDEKIKFEPLNISTEDPVNEWLIDDLYIEIVGRRSMLKARAVDSNGREVFNVKTLYVQRFESVFKESPHWWADTEVGISDDANSRLNSFLPVNVGQVKHVAMQAKAHATEALAVTALEWDAAYGGAASNPFNSDALNPSLQGQFNNLAPANIGQTKHISNGIYQAMINKGIDTNSLLNRIMPSGSTWAHSLPWSPSDATTNDYALINVGQLKFVFGFELDIPIVAPTSLQATVISSMQIDLTWSDNSENEDVFVIEQSFDGINDWRVIAEVEENIRSFSHDLLNEARTYHYRVLARRLGNYSTSSNVASGTTLDTTDANGDTIEGEDLDADHLDDAWEARYGLSNTDDGSIDSNNGPFGDFDGDGYSNIQEFIFGMRPDISDSGMGNLYTYLDADHVVLDENNKVETWVDQSSYRHDVTQSNPDLRADYIAGANHPSGRPRVLFDGGAADPVDPYDHYFISSIPETLSDISIIMVWRANEIKDASNNNLQSLLKLYEAPGSDGYTFPSFHTNFDYLTDLPSVDFHLHDGSGIGDFYAYQPQEYNVAVISILDKGISRNWEGYHNDQRMTLASDAIANDTRKLSHLRFGLMDYYDGNSGEILEFIILKGALDQARINAASVYLDNKHQIALDRDLDGIPENPSFIGSYGGNPIDAIGPAIAVDPHDGFIGKNDINKITVSYDDESGVDVNSLSVLLSQGGTPVVLTAGVLGAASTVYTIDTVPLTDGVYDLSVSIDDLFGNTGTSNTTFSVDSTGPSDLIATNISASYIELAWVDNSTDEDGFIIERSRGWGRENWKEVGVVTGNTFTDIPLNSDVWYSYRVRAYNASGESLNTGKVMVFTKSVVDADRDKLPDDWEIYYGLDSYDNGSINILNGPDGNSDGDSFSNLEEYLYGTSPLHSDTDSGDLYQLLGAGDVIDEGGYVSQWNDQSGNGRNLIQANIVSRPEYTSASEHPSGKARVSFDGVDDFFESTDSPDGNEDISIVVLWKPDVVRTAYVYDQPGTNWFHLKTLGAAHVPPQIIEDYTKIPETAYFNGQYVVSVFSAYDIGDGYNIKGSHNDLSNNVLLVANHFTKKPLRIGSKADGTDYFHGEILELMVIKRSLDTNQVAAVSRHLERKYNVVLDRDFDGNPDVDTAPTISVTPADTSTVANTPSGIVVVYDDGDGSGVDLGSLSTSLSFEGSLIAITQSVQDSSSTTYTIDSAPLADGVYDLSVSIDDLAGNTATSNTSFRIDSTGPTSLVATKESASYISIEWVDNSSDEDGFIIERRDYYGDWKEVGRATGNTFTDIPLNSGTIYHYRVRTYNATYEGLNSEALYTYTTSFIADVDGDKLPDDWEEYYGLSPNDNGSIDVNNGPEGNPDGGFNNIQEYLFATNPIETDPDSGDLFQLLGADNVVDEGGFVSQWNDQSGNGYDIVQNNVDARPQNSSSGMPKVTFDGINDIMVSNDFPDTEGGFSIVVLWKPDSVQSSYIYDQPAAPWTHLNIWDSLHTLPQAIEDYTVTPETPYFADRYMVSVLSAHRQHSHLWVNGYHNDLDNNDENIYSPFNPGQTTIGAKSDLTNFFGGEILEYMVLSRVMDSNQVEAVSRHFEKKYNISLDRDFDGNIDIYDGDGDGISDQYEIDVFGHKSLMNKTTDSDGDGVPDYKDAKRLDANVGILSISIINPTVGEQF